MRIRCGDGRVKPVYRWLGPSPKCPGLALRPPDLSTPALYLSFECTLQTLPGKHTMKAASALPVTDIAPWIEGHDHKCRFSTAAGRMS